MLLKTQNISDQPQAKPSGILIYSEGTYIHQAEDIKLKIYLNHNFKKSVDWIFLDYGLNKLALDWNLQGKMRQGRPGNTWR
jgi:hypothetical protein